MIPETLNLNFKVQFFLVKLIIDLSNSHICFFINPSVYHSIRPPVPNSGFFGHWFDILNKIKDKLRMKIYLMIKLLAKSQPLPTCPNHPDLTLQKLQTWPLKQSTISQRSNGYKIRRIT